MANLPIEAAAASPTAENAAVFRLSGAALSVAERRSASGKMAEKTGRTNWRRSRLGQYAVLEFGSASD